MISKESLKIEHLKIKDAVEEYLEGQIKVLDLKHTTARFGIYNTRDNKFMTRIRQVGGEFSSTQLTLIADLLEEHKASYAHVTTRDCIQLQGVPAEAIYNIIRRCSENDMPFKGGGGNAYRNPLISPLSGISKESIFDVRPYAIQMDLYIHKIENAFNLGRKFKVSFSSEEDDLANTAINDLGFLAKIVDNQKGFLVYSGGGLGRGPVMGNILFDFLPADQCIKAVAAMIELFHDHGDRNNRSKARLRFLAEKLGFEEFKNLYMEYYTKTEIPSEYLDFTPVNHTKTIESLVKSSTQAAESDAFKTWKKVAIKETRFKDVLSVRLFIRKGDFKARELRKLSEILDKIGCPFVRLTLEQDIYIPFVHKNFLGELYKLLSVGLEKQGATELTFKDHMVTCIGATVCGTGLLDSQSIGRAISTKLDVLMNSYPKYRGEIFSQIIDGVRVSGCGSSCAVNQIAPLGFEGIKKLLDGQLTDCLNVYTGGRLDNKEKKLSKIDPLKFITVSDAPEFIANIIEKYILKLKSDNTITFVDFMEDFNC